MHMSMRRFTRLTNGFSKKVENHAHSAALHFLHYNFARVHKTLRVTPAMEAGLATHVWSIEEIVGLLDRASAVAAWQIHSGGNCLKQSSIMRRLDRNRRSHCKYGSCGCSL